jgi:hypothetical protein
MNFKTLLILLFISVFGYSQTPSSNWELGVQLGTSYYIGELNTTHLTPVEPAVGLLLRYNYDSRVSFRYAINYGRISGSDENSNGSYTAIRNISMRNQIIESGLMAEFNFLDFSTYKISAFDKNSNIITPYVYMGLAYFYHNPQVNTGSSYVSSVSNQNEGNKISRHQVSMPLGIGLKYRKKGFGIGLDWGIRKTWTDYLDDVSAFYAGNAQIDPNVDFQRGEVYNKDWYVFTGISFFINLTERRVCPN